MALLTFIANNLQSIVILLNTIFVLAMAFSERQDPRIVVLWSVLMLAMPLVGFAVYLLFGQTFYGRWAFRRKAEEDAAAARFIGRADEPPYAKVLSETGGLPYTRGNDVRYMTGGDEFFPALFRMVDEAKEYVFLEYYIVRDDRIGNELTGRLAAKARQGVEVRLLVDGFGTMFPPKGLRALKRSGGKVRTFHSMASVILTPKKNNRNHRKIAVADGRVAMVSGFNVGREYVGEGKLGHWRDCAAEVRGDAVNTVLMAFLNDWRWAGRDTGAETGYFRDNGRAGDMDVQLALGGPDRPGANSIQLHYIEMINFACESVWITTPYFIPTDALAYALRIKALQGVDVRVIIPAAQDQVGVYWANRYHAHELMASGVRFYEYRDGFIHAKTMVVDGKVGSVGSANFDLRSMNLNMELNAMVVSEEFGRSMREAFERDLERSTQYTAEMYEGRTLGQRVRTFGSRFIETLLRFPGRGSWQIVIRLSFNVRALFPFPDPFRPRHLYGAEVRPCRTVPRMVIVVRQPALGNLLLFFRKRGLFDALERRYLPDAPG